MATHHLPAVVRKPWRTVLPDGLAHDAVDVALEVARRLAESTSELDMESGAGCAILFGHLDRYLPGQGWAVAAHNSLTSAVREAEGPNGGYVGLFGGLSGLAFAANAVSQQGARYGRLLASLDEAVTKAAIESAAAITESPRGLPFSRFDVISGAAGLGSYLLCRADQSTLRTVSTALVALCDVDDGIPNWHTVSAAMQPGTPMADGFPDGVFNCGLAHGVPGPMVVLALAEQAGISVPGQPEAIERVASWLAANRADDEWGPNWPSGFSMTGGRPAHATHSAWCYGAVGVARSLWLAGTALDDDGFRQLAVDAMAAVHHRPPSARVIDRSPGLCHGLAGALQVSSRFAQDTDEDVFKEAAATFTEMLVDTYDPSREFGYGSVTEDGSLADEPGLLDGAAGVALALLAAGTDLAPDWDRMLLLA